MINSIVCEFYFSFLKSKMIPSLSPLKPLHSFPWFTSQPVPRNREGGSPSVQGQPWAKEGRTHLLWFRLPAPAVGSLWPWPKQKGRHCRTALLRDGHLPVPTDWDPGTPCVSHTHLHMGVPPSPHPCIPPLSSPPHTVFYVLTSTRYTCGSPRHSDLCTDTDAETPPSRLDAHLPSPGLKHSWKCTQTYILSQHDTAETRRRCLLPVLLSGNFHSVLCLTTTLCTHMCMSVCAHWSLGAGFRSKKLLLRHCLPWTSFHWVSDLHSTPNTPIIHGQSPYLMIASHFPGKHPGLTLPSLGSHQEHSKKVEEKALGPLTHTGSSEGSGRGGRLLPHFIPFFSRGIFQRHPRGAWCRRQGVLPQGPESGGRGVWGDCWAHQAPLGSTHRGICSLQNFPDSPLYSAGSWAIL